MVKWPKNPHNVLHWSLSLEKVGTIHLRRRHFLGVKNWPNLPTDSSKKTADGRELGSKILSIYILETQGGSPRNGKIFFVSLELSSTSILVKPRGLKDQSDQGRPAENFRQVRPPYYWQLGGAPSRYIPRNQGNTKILPFLLATASLQILT